MEERDALKTNWQSAQCVTSLYDSYIQLQGENEQLRDEIRQRQQNSSDLKAVDGKIEMEEIRLLQSEKLRLEEKHRLAVESLEARAVKSETQYQQLVDKYHERFEFDPLEVKRANLAVKTMQKTLEKEILEKEELGIRYGKLQEEYWKVSKEQMDLVATLQRKVQMLELERVKVGQQRVLNALATWSTNKLQKAWNQWLALARKQRQDDENQRIVSSLKHAVDAQIATIRERQVAAFGVRATQQTARRTFVCWKEWALRISERRRKETWLVKERARRKMHEVMTRWRKECRDVDHQYKAVMTLERVMTRHLRRWGMQHWRRQTLDVVLAETSRTFDTYTKTMKSQAKTIGDLERALDQERSNARAIQMRYEEQDAAHVAKIEKHRATQVAVRQKLGQFFTKQSDRQVLKKLMREWRTMTSQVMFIRQRTSVMKTKLQMFRLERSVLSWHHTVHEKHKKRVQLQQIFGRMRQLGALKCFNLWKERVQTHKLQNATLQDAVNRMRNKKVAWCFTQWRSIKEKQMGLCNGIRIMAKYVIKQQLRCKFHSWKKRVVNLRLQAQAQQQQLIEQAWEERLVQAKQNFNLQRRYYIRWNEVVIYRHRRGMLLKKCVGRLKSISVARVLGSWRNYVECRRNQRDLVRRWIDRYHIGTLQRVWIRLQRQVALKEHQLNILRIQEEQRAEVQHLETQLSECRKTQELQLTKAEQLQAHYERSLKEALVRLHKEAKRAQRFANTVESLCSIRLCESLQLRCFKAWRSESHRSIRCRQTAQVFRAALIARRTRVLLLRWQQFQAQQKRVTAGFTMIRSCVARWSMLECMKAWKEARRRRRAVHVLTTLFARNMETFIAREVMTEWRKVARKNQLLRRTLEDIWLNSVHTEMRRQFAHWAAFTKAEAAREQRERRKTALATISGKVWWRNSLSAMRLGFLGWKTVVAMQKKQRLAQQKLWLLRNRRLEMRSFQAWADLIWTKRKNEGFARWMRRVQRRKQQRAMTRWKALVIQSQVRDLHDMKTVLQAQSEEIRVLRQITAETERTLTNVRDASLAKVQRLTQCGLMAKCFQALRLKVSMRSYQRQAVYFCQKNARRQHLAELFSCWYSFHHNLRTVKVAVDEKVRRSHDALTRTIIRQWHVVAHEQCVMRQKHFKLQQRLDARNLAKTFGKWRHFICEEGKMALAMTQLEALAQRFKLKKTLLAWHMKCLAIRNRELEKRERHTKIMQFMMGRQDAKLVRMFYAWKTFFVTAQTARSQAHECFTRRRQDIVLECWQCWRSTSRTMKVQRKSLECMNILIERYYFRAVLARWVRYRFLSQIAVLQNGNEALTLQVTESSRALQCSSMSLDRLSSEVMALQDQLKDVQLSSSAEKLLVVSKERRLSKQLKCAKALSKVFQQRIVLRAVVKAFTVWKTKLFDLRRTHDVLASVLKLQRRQRRLGALWTWKIKTLRHRQFDALKRTSRRNNLRAICQRWRRYSTSQRKLRLLLMKRWLTLDSTRGLPVAIAFRLWQTKSVQVTAHQHVAALRARLRTEQRSSCIYLRRLALGKWSWIAYHHRLRQMRAFLSRCYVTSSKNTDLKHRRTLNEMQLKSDDALAKVKEQSEARDEEELGAGSSFQALHTLIRHLFQSMTIKDLFMSVSSTFAQLLHGGAAVLFLFDPSSNELWTQREEDQVIQVPASLGIAGSTLTSGSTLTITNVVTDSRFHPMVDQFVLSRLGQDDAMRMVASPSSLPATKPIIGMVSSALVSTDGAVYGILQVAFPASNLSLIDRRVLVTQTHLYSKTCCYFVEQMLVEVLHNCRDRIRARSPHKLIKLFKQSRNWRKYYAVIERKACELETKLDDVLNEYEELAQAKRDLQERHQHVKDQLEHKERNTKDVAKLVVDWKQKLTKWQKVLDEKDRTIEEKTRELEKLEKDLERHRRQWRAKELLSPTRVQVRQSSIVSSTSDEDNDDTRSKTQALSDRSQLSILRAHQTRLKSQLVRAEADNLLLVKAIGIARTQQGELPRTIQAEVTRVTTRVTRQASLEA